MSKAATAILAVGLAVLMFVAGATTNIPDQQQETLGTCVPIYYSGLECCKN